MPYEIQLITYYLSKLIFFPLSLQEQDTDSNVLISGLAFIR